MTRGAYHYNLELPSQFFFIDTKSFVREKTHTKKLSDYTYLYMGFEKKNELEILMRMWHKKVYLFYLCFVFKPSTAKFLNNQYGTSTSMLVLRKSSLKLI